MRNMVFVLVVMLALTGCGAINPVTITDNMVNEAGDVITTGIVQTSDVDVVRSTNFSKMRMNRDRIQGKAHEKSGFKMDFVAVEIAPGYKAYLPKTIEYRPELRMQDQMPAQEMVNPAYAAFRDVSLGLFDVVLKGFGVWAIADVHKNSVEAAQPRYGGAYNYQSLNQTAEPFIVNPVIVQ
jgi:hypothetical protein